MTRDEYIALAYRLYDGGFTVDVDGAEPTSGYMVSIPGHELVRVLKPGATTVDGIAAFIEGYVVDNGRELRDPGAYLGGWRDGARLVLDVSVNFTNRGAAIALAKTYDQDAIYDVANAETIPTR